MTLNTIALAAMLIIPILPAGAQTTEGFPDVPKTHWAYEAVTDLKARGIIVGYPPAASPAATPSPAVRPDAGRRLPHPKTDRRKRRLRVRTRS